MVKKETDLVTYYLSCRNCKTGINIERSVERVREVSREKREEEQTEIKRKKVN